MYRSLQPPGPLVAQHLHLLPAGLRWLPAQLLAHRISAGVDFILYGPSRFLAIEVKRSARIDRRDLRPSGLSATTTPEADRLLLSFCPEPLLIDGIRCEPIEPWLRALSPFSQAVPPSASPSPGPAGRSSSPGCS